MTSQFSYYLYLCFEICAVYVNSLLATLNARKGLLSGLNGGNSCNAVSSESFAVALRNTMRVRPLVPSSQDAYGFDVQSKVGAHPITFAETKTQTREDESMKDKLDQDSAIYEC